MRFVYIRFVYIPNVTADVHLFLLKKLTRRLTPLVTGLICFCLGFLLTGYDGGDCCSCTCVSTETRTCGEYGEYACLDPSASCVDDDDVTMPVNYEDDPESTTSLECYDDLLADGDCDLRNNVDRCGEMYSAAHIARYTVVLLNRLIG